MIRHIVIGAGISGLALGWFLKKRFGEKQNLTILEAGEHPGGWIRTHADKGFLFEAGPRSCRTKGAGIDTLQLIEELGLCQQVISASPSAKSRYIYQEGKIQTVPNTFFSFLFSPLMRGVLPALWKEWQIPTSDLEDETVAHFISRRLSPEIAEKLMDPLVSGIYAGDIRQLSIRSCFPDLHRMELEQGSLVKGMLQKKKMDMSHLSEFVRQQSRTSIFSFKNGMQTLTTTLYSQMQDVIRLSNKVKAVHVAADALQVELQNGVVLKGDRVFLAVPAYAAAELLKTVDPLITESMIQEVYATVATVNMGWNQRVLKQEGFGYLVPSSEKQNILGVVFDSSAFPQQNGPNQRRLTVMLGGMHHPEIENLPSDEIEEIAGEAILRHLGITQKPDAVKVSVARQAIPQYTKGHHARLFAFEQKLKRISASRIYLTGSAWRGVAVNDCIAEAKKLVTNIDHSVIQ